MFFFSKMDGLGFHGLGYGHKPFGSWFCFANPSLMLGNLQLRKRTGAWGCPFAPLGLGPQGPRPPSWISKVLLKILSKAALEAIHLARNFFEAALGKATAG